jgi:hypothetical protein
VPYHPAPRLTLPVWERLAAWLAFLAVLSALWAPVSMLAQDVQNRQAGRHLQRQHRFFRRRQ